MKQRLEGITLDMMKQEQPASRNEYLGFIRGDKIEQTKIKDRDAMGGGGGEAGTFASLAAG